MKRFYPAIVDKNPNATKKRRGSKEIAGAYGVRILGVDGCYSAGDTIEEAIANAAEALDLHFETMREEGMEIPDPVGFEELARENGGEFTWDPSVLSLVLVPATFPSTPVRINITMDGDLLEEIDAVASNRSAFLAEAARAELTRRQAGKIPVYRLSDVEARKAKRRRA